ncbi:MAG: peptide chain release factor N(5)-glutamine methyltransferase [Actinomycetota bacterium]
MSDDDLEGTVSWAELARETEAILSAAGFADASGQARRIAMRASGADGEEWLSRSADLATKRGVASLDAMVARRLTGEPLQYVLGEWGFRYLDLFIDRRVLIPRPETEVVAGLALAELARSGEDGRPLMAADLGTGSGAIGLALVTEHPTVELWLTDVSSDALDVARANLAGIGRAAARVRVEEGSWFDALPLGLRSGLDLVVSNPPYVTIAEELPADVADWEPELALRVGPEGTEALDVLVAEAPAWLRSDGALVLEMAPHQVEPVAERARAHFAQVETHRDLAGRWRAVVARHPSAEIAEIRSDAGPTDN